MSSALVKQALELVDPEESGKKKRRPRPTPYQVSSATPGQGFLVHNKKIKKSLKSSNKLQEQIAEENIKKLLTLSKPTADSAIAAKIIKRAIKGKPLADKIEVKIEEEKSILFPEEETSKSIENKYICS